MENENSFSQELYHISSKRQEVDRSLLGQRAFRRPPHPTDCHSRDRDSAVFPFPPKALQSHYYCSPWKNEETEAQKEKALGHQDPVCGDREEVKVLLPGCPKPGTEWGTLLLHIPL